MAPDVNNACSTCRVGTDYLRRRLHCIYKLWFAGLFIFMLYSFFFSSFTLYPACSQREPSVKILRSPFSSECVSDRAQRRALSRNQNKKMNINDLITVAFTFTRLCPCVYTVLSAILLYTIFF